MSFTDLLFGADRPVREILGGPVTYTPGVGASVNVRGVFDSSYTRVDLGQPGVSSQGPAVFLRLEDLPSDPATDTGATVTISGVIYSVHEVKPDGVGGGVVLMLHVA